MLDWVPKIFSKQSNRIKQLTKSNCRSPEVALFVVWPPDTLFENRLVCDGTGATLLVGVIV